MGAGLFNGLTITAGIVASVAIDHFGLMKFAQHTASPGRVGGAALMIAGVILVALLRRHVARAGVATDFGGLRVTRLVPARCADYGGPCRSLPT